MHLTAEDEDLKSEDEDEDLKFKDKDPIHCNYTHCSKAKKQQIKTKQNKTQNTKPFQKPFHIFMTFIITHHMW